MINDIDRNHADGRQLEFERAVSTLMQSRQFWASYYDLPTVEIDSAAIVDVWNGARTAVGGQLQTKLGAPLDAQSLNQSTLEALDAYSGHRQAIAAINQTSKTANEEIQQVKQQAQTAETGKLTTTLNELKATKSRSAKILLYCAALSWLRWRPRCTLKRHEMKPEGTWMSTGPTSSLYCKME